MYHEVSQCMYEVSRLLPLCIPNMYITYKKPYVHPTVTNGFLNVQSTGTSATLSKKGNDPDNIDGTATEWPDYIVHLEQVAGL